MKLRQTGRTMGFVVLVLLVNCMVCVFGQSRSGYSYSYSYPTSNYASNYRYYQQGANDGNYRAYQQAANDGNYRSYQQVADDGYYQQRQPSPCQSPCGNYRPISYCNRLPCYAQQPSYYIPYAQYNPKIPVAGTYPYQNVIYPGSRVSSSSSYSDPYANIPVEIIDEADLGNRQNNYANVPTEIISDPNVPIQWKKIPVLPKVSQSSQSNYAVSYGAINSKSQSQNPPIRATVTRTFPPKPQEKPEVTLDFLNGALVNNSETTATTTEQEEIITTETPTTTTEESEDVPEVKSWF